MTEREVESRAIELRNSLERVTAERDQERAKRSEINRRFSNLKSKYETARADIRAEALAEVVARLEAGFDGPEPYSRAWRSGDFGNGALSFQQNAIAAVRKLGEK